MGVRIDRAAFPHMLKVMTDSATKKDSFFMLRVRAEERQLWVEEAERRGTTLSSLVRSAMNLIAAPAKEAQSP
jgi:hypothetical protein